MLTMAGLCLVRNGSANPIPFSSRLGWRLRGRTTEDGSGFLPKSVPRSAERPVFPENLTSVRVLQGHLLNSHAKHKLAAVALLRAEVLEPVAVDDDGCAAPGVVDRDAVEHGRNLVEELLLARCPCLGFNLPQRPL